MLQVRGHGPVPAPPVDRPGRHVHPIRGGVSEGDAARVRAQDRGDRGPRLSLALEGVLEEVLVGPARAQFPGLGVGHRAGRLARHRPGRARVEVDARGRGRQRLADRGDLLVIGQEWRHHARMIGSGCPGSC